MEDNVMVREIIAAVLEEDYQVAGVGSVRDAFSALVLTAVDGIILDCSLPDGSYKAIVSYARRAHHPMVLITGRLENMLELDRVNEPFLLKPFRPEQLLELLSSVVSRSPRALVPPGFRTGEGIGFTAANTGRGGQRRTRRDVPQAAAPNASARTAFISQRTVELMDRADLCVQETSGLLQRQAVVTRWHENRRPFDVSRPIQAGMMSLSENEAG